MQEKRATNAFVKQIFDKSTDSPLLCRLHQTTPPHQTFSLGWWDRECISYDLVMEQVVAALSREHAEAVRMLQRLKSGDGEAKKEEQKRAVTEQVRQLSLQVAQISKERLELLRMREASDLSDAEYEARRAEISAGFSEKEEQISVLMKRAEELELVFSEKNPWVQLYAGLEVPDRLEKAQVRAWIDRVLVCDWKTVEVVFPGKYIYWKKQLPAEWF